jgi:hypothetical protein
LSSQEPPRTPQSRRARTGSVASGAPSPLRLPTKVGLADNTMASGGGGSVQQSPRAWERRAPAPRTPERVDSGMTVPIGLRDSRDSRDRFEPRDSTATTWAGMMRQAKEGEPPLPDARGR